MKLSQRQSQRQAELIDMAKLFLLQLDKEYLKEALEEMKKNSSMFDSAAPLMSNYSPTKSQVKHAECRCLDSLILFRERLKEVDELKQYLAVEEAEQDRINKLFS